MSDEPLPVTLDNIRKWDADMRGSDDQARHIALYYFATNLREVVVLLLAERDALLIALHDAIRRPMGVVPASADPFYNPVFAAQAEVRRIEKEAAMSEGVGG